MTPNDRIPHSPTPACGARRRRVSRSAPALLIAAAVLLTLVGLAPATRAEAATPAASVTYQGSSISMASVPATQVQLTAVSPTRITSASFAVGGRVLATTSAVTQRAGTWQATATVDLTGRSGLTQVRTRLLNGTVGSTVDKTLRAVAPPTAGRLPAPTAAPKSSTPAVPTAAPKPSTVTQPVVAVPVSAPGPVAGPDTTGVPAGVVLTKQTGDLTISTNGTVVDGLDLTGCITVAADDVVIRNSRITCSRSSATMVVATNGSYRNLLVQDSELDGQGVVDIGIGWQNYTLRRVEVRGTNDGARMGSNTTVEASWIHDLVRKGGLHPDAVQSTGGIGIRVTGNTLDPRNHSTGDQGNAAVMLGSELRPNVLQDVVVSGNRLSGGNYTVNVRGDAAIAGVTVSGNTFTADAKYGPLLVPSSVTTTPDNVMAGTGAVARVVRAV